MNYLVYRLLHLTLNKTDIEWKVLFYKRNIDYIFNFLEKQIQAHLFKIEGLDEEANFHEIDIEKNLYKKRLIIKQDGLDIEDGISFLDYANSIDAKNDGIMFMKLLYHTYDNDNFKRFDELLTNQTKKFLNTNNLEEFAINPYVTLFKK